MEIFDTYGYIILSSSIIIVSFLFNAFSEKTNIPAVILLIGTGVLIKEGFNYLHIEEEVNLFPLLEVVGTLGLIMIVLEAALDLKLTKDNLPQIGKSFMVALIGLLVATFVSAGIIHYMIPGMDEMTSLLYATPLSILSSAIIIPSVGNLPNHKREFHVYESTFSDILGIMLFYFLIGLHETSDSTMAIAGFFGNFFVTIIISLLASYLLIFLFQKITAHVKLFLLIAILLLLYSIGKQYHLSSLIIILIFGLVMTNEHIFFMGFLKKWLDKEKLHHTHEDFHVITIETAFVVRTFFFVIFGFTIDLQSLWKLDVLLVSLAILASIYILRYLLFKIFVQKDVLPQVYIAPRGLITVLLFFQIPEEFRVENFEEGILLFIIIATSIVMTLALIADGRRRAQAEKLAEEQSLIIPPNQIYEGFKSELMNKFPQVQKASSKSLINGDKKE